MSLGRWGGFPFRFGGGKGFKQKEFLALKTSLAGPNRTGYNTDDPLIDLECEAHALALAAVWKSNQRTANQAIPTRMLEETRRWETIMRLPVAPDDTDQDRRAAVAAKFRGLLGNAMPDIEDVCREVLGPNYVGVNTVADSDQITWWPGVAPGPPGFEWTSNRCTIGVAMTRAGLSDSEVQGKIARLVEKLDAMLPAWMTFQVGVDDSGTGAGFIVDIGIVDLTLL